MDRSPGVCELCEDVRKAAGEFGKHSGPSSFFLLVAMYGDCEMKTYHRLKECLLLQINQALCVPGIHVNFLLVLIGFRFYEIILFPKLL
jgi:hypothetical protein